MKQPQVSRLAIKEALKPMTIEQNLACEFIADFGVDISYTKENLLKFVSMMQSELNEMKKAIEEEDYEGILDADVDLRYFLEQFTLIGRNSTVLQPAFQIVHMSNMAKKINGVIKKSDGADGLEVGKVLKPEGWKPADLSYFVRKQQFELPSSTEDISE